MSEPKPFKPMLSGVVPDDLETLRYPVLASPKLDGIRCIILDGVAVSRKLKPIPNEFVRGQLQGLPDGFDGELIVEGGFNACQSAFMRSSGDPGEFRFCVFDWCGDDPNLPFKMRLAASVLWEEQNGNAYTMTVQHVVISNADELREYAAECLALGFEGVMVRDPKGPYKFGRSTQRQGWLLKFKDWATEECWITGVVEQMHNENELEQDALGHAKRSSAKGGKVPAGTLGTLVGRTQDGAEIRMGTGFTDQQRAELWADRESLFGRPVTFKHQPDPGGRQPGQAPRFPIFLGFRSPEDMSE